MSKYHWVFNPDDRNAPHLCNVGINDDGTLVNPNGYPDELVRRAVIAADQRRHKRRSEAAKKAAQTRRERQEKQTYRIAKRLIAGGRTGPATRCAICSKELDDRDSIARGIGSECWQGVLSAIARIKDKGGR